MSLSSSGHCDFYIIAPIHSGSRVSVNQEAVDLSLVAGLPVFQAMTAPSVNLNLGSVNTLIPSSYTTPSCTRLSLELHIDEEGCSVLTSSAASMVVCASSKSFQYSQIHQINDGDRVRSEISHVESLSLSSAMKTPTEVNSPTNVSATKVSASKASSLLDKSSSPITVGRSSSPVPTAKSFSPGVISKSPSPVTAPVNSSPILRARSPSPPDLKCSNQLQSPSPVPNSDNPVLVSHTPELKNANPVTVPRLSSPVQKNVNPDLVHHISGMVTVPKTASPVTIPRLSSPVSKSASPVPKIPSMVTVPKSATPEMVASPVSIPRLSSPGPKIASPVVEPNVSSSASAPKSSSPETLPKNVSPVTLPRLSSPVTIPRSETVVTSPASVTRKTHTVAGISSPRASPVQHGAVQLNSLSSFPSQKQGGEILDLTWPCRDPLLDDALDKLLSPDSNRLSENQRPAFMIPGDEDRSWEEEDGIYPDLSREGTLTPMTESSWMDECFTPSTCPGTPDATLDLPTQQPSAVERLSASGQVGR